MGRIRAPERDGRAKCSVGTEHNRGDRRLGWRSAATGSSTLAWTSAPSGRSAVTGPNTTMCWSGRRNGAAGQSGIAHMLSAKVGQRIRARYKGVDIGVEPSATAYTSKDPARGNKTTYIKMKRPAQRLDFKRLSPTFAPTSCSSTASLLSNNMACLHKMCMCVYSHTSQYTRAS